MQRYCNQHRDPPAHDCEEAEFSEEERRDAIDREVDTKEPVTNVSFDEVIRYGFEVVLFIGLLVMGMGVVIGVGIAMMDSSAVFGAIIIAAGLGGAACGFIGLQYKVIADAVIRANQS